MRFLRSPSEHLQLHELDASGVGGDLQAERAASTSSTFWYLQPRRTSFRVSVLAVFVLDVLLTALLPVLARSPDAPPPNYTLLELLVLLLALYAYTNFVLRAHYTRSIHFRNEYCTSVHIWIFVGSIALVAGGICAVMCGGGRSCVLLRYWATFAVLVPLFVLAAFICGMNLVNECVFTFVHSVRVLSAAERHHLQHVKYLYPIVYN